MTLDEIIRNRRSIRKYTSEEVSEDALRQILEAGRLAPSASNSQNWHFTLVRDKETLAQLSEACHGQAMVKEAPAALVVWAEKERAMSCGQSAASLDCSIALSFMMLKATDLGLGTCWIGAFDADAVREVLGLPYRSVMVALTPLGHPAESPAPRPRKTFEEVAEIRG